MATVLYLVSHKNKKSIEVQEYKPSSGFQNPGKKCCLVDFIWNNRDFTVSIDESLEFYGYELIESCDKCKQ